MIDTERFERLENNCFVLATMLGMCAGRTALAQGSNLFVDDMKDAATSLKERGIPAILVDAFNAGATVGIEPCPPDGDGLLNNVIELFQRSAAA